MDEPTNSPEALSIPHILKWIIQVSKPRTQVACATVCRSWHETALDVIWHYLDKPQALFNVIENLSGRKSIPSDHIWQRFLFYGQRVRHLDFGEDTFLDHSRCTRLILLKPMQHMLPRLTSLTWSCRNLPLSICLPFLAPSIRTIVLTFAIDKDDWNAADQLEDLEAYLSNLSSRCSDLRDISIQTGVPWDTLRRSIDHFLATLSKVRRISLPAGLADSQLLATVSQLPEVEEAALLGLLHGAEDYEHSKQLKSFDCFHDPGSFINLKCIEALTTLSAVRSLLSTTPFPPRLRSIVFYAKLYDFIPNFKGLLATIADSIPLIESLLLACTCTRNDIIPEEQENFLDVDEFRPLSQCLQLRCLDLALPFSTIFTRDDLVSLVSSWSQIKELNIMGTYFLTAPQYPIVSDLETLVEVGILRPGLRDMGFIVDAKAIPTRLDLPELQQLEVLNLGILGNSTNVDATDLAIFLAQITPDNCKIDVSFLPASQSQHTNGSGNTSGAAESSMNRAIHEIIPHVRRIHRRLRRQGCSVCSKV